MIVAINKIDRPTPLERVRIAAARDSGSNAGGGCSTSRYPRPRSCRPAARDIGCSRNSSPQGQLNRRPKAPSSKLLDRGRRWRRVLVQRGSLSRRPLAAADWAACARWFRHRHADHARGRPVEVLGSTAPDRVGGGQSEGVHAGHGLSRPAAARQDGRARHRHARLARADDEPAQGLRPQGSGADHQGRRAGLARGDHRLDREARHRRGRRAGDPLRGRRHHRIRRDVGGSIRRTDHRLQRACPQRGARGGRARRHRDPLLQHHLRSRGRREEGDVRPCTELRETMLGNATIWRSSVSKVGNVAGCRVTDGVVERGANVRLIRDSVVVHEASLQPSASATTREVSPARNAAWPSRTIRI